MQDMHGNSSIEFWGGEKAKQHTELEFQLWARSNCSDKMVPIFLQIRGFIQMFQRRREVVLGRDVFQNVKRTFNNGVFYYISSNKVNQPWQINKKRLQALWTHKLSQAMKIPLTREGWEEGRDQTPFRGLGMPPTAHRSTDTYLSVRWSPLWAACSPSADFCSSRAAESPATWPSRFPRSFSRRLLPQSGWIQWTSGCCKSIHHQKYFWTFTKLARQETWRQSFGHGLGPEFSFHFFVVVLGSEFVFHDTERTIFGRDFLFQFRQLQNVKKTVNSNLGCGVASLEQSISNYFFYCRRCTAWGLSSFCASN